MAYLGRMSAQPEWADDARPPSPDELAELLQPGADWDRDGFHPTMARPFPSMQCTGVVKSGDKAGQRCSKRALYGATVCLSHGAQLPVVRAKAEKLVESARLKLINAADEAAEWLLDLGANSTSDAVRLKAATEVLDRAGVKGGVEVDVNVTHSQDPGDLLRERLATLRKRTIEGQLAGDDTLAADTQPPVEEQS